jgi:hypothetical protein
VAATGVSLGSYGVKPVLNGLTGGLHGGFVGIARHFDRLSPEKNPATKGDGQQKTIPGAENLPS